jgi:hypothetical protein
LPTGKKRIACQPCAQFAGSLDGNIALGLVSGRGEGGDAVALLAA